jgi:thiamine transport system permease protein
LITSLELLSTTAIIAVASSLMSVVLGIPFGSWLRSLDPKTARLIAAITLVPFLLPPFLVGLAFEGIFGVAHVNSNLGMFLIIAAHVFMNFGFIGKVFASTTIDSEQIESARLAGATDRQIRLRIELPQQRHGIIAAALLVALYSATSFGLVVTLGAGKVRNLETEIAIAALQNLDLNLAATFAVLQTLLTIAMFLLSRVVGGAPTALDEIAPSLIQPSRFERLLGASLSGAVLIAIAIVVSRAMEGEGLLVNLANLSSKGERNVLNLSVLEASFNSLRNAAAVVLISVPLAYLLASRKRPSSWVLIPIGISPVVVGLVTLAVVGYLPRALTSSWILLPLVQVLFALPVAFQILRPARMGIDPELLEASRMDGANKIQTMRMIELPLLKKSFTLAITFSAMVSIGEFGAASFLAFGSNETLPIVMFKLLGRPGVENLGMAMTVAAIYILIAAYVIWFSLKPTRKRLRYLPTVR